MADGDIETTTSESSSSETLDGHLLSATGATGMLLRLSLGTLFFVAALNKFLGEGGASGASRWIIGEFRETYLPWFLVAPFAYVLPYVEIVLGALLILGLFTRWALTFCGLLLISLAMGKAVTHDYATVSQNLNYVLLAAAGLWFASRDNPYALDAVLRHD